MDKLWQDVRYGLRSLAKKPAFTAVAVLALCLGIGANTAIFSVINGVLLRPLPFEQPDNIVMVWEKRVALGRERNPVSAPDFHDWRAQNTVFEEMAAYQPTDITLAGASEPEKIPAAAVHPGFFSVLRAKPGLGRTFLSDEDRADKNSVVVISHGLWQSRFGGDPNIINRTVTINDKSYTVVGVMPARFSYPEAEVAAWIPLTLSERELSNRGSHSLLVIARLKPDVPIDQARAEMQTIASNLEQQHQVNTGHSVNVFGLYEEVVGSSRSALWIIFGAVAFVLLIACANVANLQLARSTSRQKEIAIRSALGASRFRIVRQLLTESLLLSLAGAVLGLLLALWWVDILLAISPGAVPRTAEISLDGRVLAFTLAVAFITGLVMGIVPALHASRPHLNEALKEGGRSSSAGGGNRVRSALVIAEVAICLILLIAAGLMMKSFVKLLDVNPGFNPENAVAVNVTLSRSKYEKGQQIAAFFQQSLERVSALPGVKSAGVASNLPLGQGFGSRYFSIEGRPPLPPGQGYNANTCLVTPGYFNAMSIPLIRGRDFANGDTYGTPDVVVINEEMARQFWPDEDALGQRVRVGEGPWRTIIGIVGSVKNRGLDAEPRQEMYWPYYQGAIPGGTFVVRTESNPEAMTAAIRSAIGEVDKDQPLSDMRTLEQVMSESVAPRRFNMLLLAVFAGVALLLAAVGLYGVISYSVTQRTHEIGIRMALGARPADVMKLVVGQGLVLTAIGIGMGLVGAYFLTQFMATLLFGVNATDLSVFIAIPSLLASVALIASVVPARRAIRVDPMVALRSE